MRQKNFWFVIGGIFAVFALVMMVPTAAAANNYKVLHKFKGKDGAGPSAGLIFDAAGNLYGTTSSGGDLTCPDSFGGCGVVFKLARQSDGSWAESVLYYFCPDVNCSPSGLTRDAAGNLYGTTSGGGLNGGGQAFKLASQSYGISVLYPFCSLTNCADGWDPVAGLTRDAAGNLYGTTLFGGNANCTRGCGVVFKLAPQSDGSWVESVIHTFSDHPAAFPYAAVIFDSAGNLYGTTTAGGPENDGAVFKLAPGSGGGWTYDVLHVFHGTPAAYPYAGLVLGKDGNLYGTASACGSGYKCQGVVFEITP